MSEESAATNILHEYGKVLQSANPDTFYDEKCLPYPKEVIRKAILERVEAVQSIRERGALKAALLSLAYYQPDVGGVPVANPVSQVAESDDMLRAIQEMREGNADMSAYKYLCAEKEKEQQQYMQAIESLNDDYPPFENFVKGYKDGTYKVSIDENAAKEVVRKGLLTNRGEKASMLFYEWVWLGLLIGGVITLFYIWWAGLLMLFVSFKLPAAIRRTAAEGVKDQMLADEVFYKLAVESELALLRMEEP